MKFNLKSSVVPAMTGILLVGSGMMLLPFSASAIGLGAGLGVSASTSASVGSIVSANAGVSASLKTQAGVTRVQNRADQEITRRESALNALSTRISAVVNISATEKASISAMIQSQLQALSDLQTKIASDANADATSSLKTDVASITTSYRIFALVIPQGAIAAASDRGLTIVDLLQAVGGKLQTRITAAQNAGADVTTVNTAYADFTAKIVDAQTNLQASINETASLTPDNGNQAQMASNTAALKDARAKIKLANQDFVTARADAQSIIKSLEKWDANVNASTTVNASATAQ